MSKVVGSENFFYIDESKIHRKGVFSNRKFQKEEVICLLEGKIIKSPSVEERLVSIQLNNDIFFKPRGVGRFLNHSCDPNTKLIFFNNSLMLRAKKEILKGDEITYNYCSSDFELMRPFTCNCDNCLQRNKRKFISGYKDLTLLEKKKIKNDVLPYLQNK